MATLNTEKKVTLTESYKHFISSFITEEAEKYLAQEKADALANNQLFQQKKAELSKLKAEILANVTNKLYARKLAVNFGRKWKIDADTLETMIVDKNGICIKDGKKVTLSTIPECASFMAYLFTSLTKSTKRVLDERHEIYIDVKGGLEWNDDIQAVCTKVAQRRNIKVEDVLQAYETEKAKEEKEKAKA